MDCGRRRAAEAGEGLYAVVPPRANVPAAQAGAIFCLRYRMTPNNKPGSDAKPSDSTQLNPLAPYYLVYVHDDGTVRFSFARPKESILLFRDLAAGESTALEKLCELFDAGTKDGTDMSRYDCLLQKALASIEYTFQKRAASTLLSSRSAVLPAAGEIPKSDSNDFELVTWLVVMDNHK